MKKPGTTAIVTAAVLLAFALFAGLRVRETRAVQDRLGELERKAAQLLAASAEVEELKKRVPPRADVSSFVEQLTSLARGAGFRDLEITTLPVPKRPAGPPRRDAPPAQLATYPVRLSFEGGYRAAAEFLRQVRGLERHTRVVELEMKPSTNAIRVRLVVEITSFEGADAA
jgi:Tfp pilus assembly protein PilO